MDHNHTLHDLIKSALKDRSITWRDAANQCGVTIGCLANAIKGNPLKYSTLEKFASWLGVDAEKIECKLSKSVRPPSKIIVEGEFSLRGKLLSAGFGNVARAIGVSITTLRQWIKFGVPDEYVSRLESVIGRIPHTCRRSNWKTNSDMAEAMFRDMRSDIASSRKGQICTCGWPKINEYDAPGYVEIGRKNVVRCSYCGKTYTRPLPRKTWFERAAMRAASIRDIPQNAIQQTIAAWVWLVSILMALQIFGFSIGASSSPTPTVITEQRRDE